MQVLLDPTQGSLWDPAGSSALVPPEAFQSTSSRIGVTPGRLKAGFIFTQSRWLLFIELVLTQHLLLPKLLEPLQAIQQRPLICSITGDQLSSYVFSLQ